MNPFRNNQKIKVAFVIDYIHNDIGGTEKQLIELIRRLDRDKVDPVLVCLYETDYIRKTSLPCPLHVLGFRGFLKSNVLQIIKKFRAIVRENNVQIIQTFFEESVFIVSSALLGMKNKPIRITSRRDMGMGKGHPWYQSIYNTLRPLIIKNFDGVVVNAQAISTYVQKKDSVEADKIHVIHNGVDVPQSLTPQKDHSEFNIVFTANFNAVKRHDIFIHACKLLKEKSPNLNFKAYLLGQGSEYGKEEQNLKRQVDHNNLTNHVVFAGPVKNVPDYLDQADVGVLCSDLEGLSNAILEYMTHGLPVVATAVGGNVELVDPSNGICFPPRQPLQLAEALFQLSEDKNRCKKLGEQSFKKVSQYFSWDRSIKETISLFEMLLEGKKAEGYDPKKIRIIRNIDELTKIQQQWEDLSRQNPENNLWMSYEWFFHWYKAKSKLANLYVLVYEENGRIKAIGPYLQMKERRCGVPIKTIGFDYEYLPNELVISNEYYSFYAECFLRKLLENDRDWDFIWFGNQFAKNVSKPQIKNIFSSYKTRYSLDDLEPLPIIEISPSWKTYWDSRSKNFKKSLRNRFNRLSKKGIHTDVKTFSRPEDIEEGLKLVFDTAKKSWQAKEGTDIASGYDSKFYSAYAKDAANSGKIEIKILYIDHVPVSFEFNAIRKDKVYCLKCGYDRNYHHTSPGSLLMKLNMDEYEKRNIQVINLLGGVDEFKRGWMTTEENMVGLRMYSNSFLPFMAYVLRHKITRPIKNIFSAKK